MSKKNKILKTVNVEVPLIVKEGMALCFSSGSFSTNIDGEKVTGQIALGGTGFMVSWRNRVFKINGRDVCEALLDYIRDNIPAKEIL